MVLKSFPKRQSKRRLADSPRRLRDLIQPVAESFCPGVRVGAETVIGAGSVVTRDLPARVFAAGNPCRVIREISE